MMERCSKILRRFSGCRVFQQNKPGSEHGLSHGMLEILDRFGHSYDDRSCDISILECPDEVKEN
jgi:hypothetical protein